MAHWALDQLMPELQAQARAKIAAMPTRMVQKLNANAPVRDERSPETILPAPAKRSKTTEHAEQCAAIDWWKMSHRMYKLPEFALYAIPNAAKRSPRTGSSMKAEGLRAGMSDLNLDVVRGGLAGLRIEMKIKPNTLTKEQKEVQLYYNGAGYKAVVCWSSDEAIKVIKQYLER